MGDRHEIYGLRSRGFRDWLIDGYLIGRPVPPSDWAIRRILGMLEARARFGGDIPDVFVRVGAGVGEMTPNSVYFLDLGDPSGRAIRISARVGASSIGPASTFGARRAIMPLPVPSRDGSIDSLRKYVNLTESRFSPVDHLVDGGAAPGRALSDPGLERLARHRQENAGQDLRLLIDPQVCPAVALPGSTHDLLATAVNGWLLAYDNVSDIPDWLSDALCQLVFGGGFAGRAFFTNDERSVIYAQRPVLLSGIDDFVCRADLQRPRRVPEHPTDPRLAPARGGRVLEGISSRLPPYPGGVLNLVAGGLGALPGVHSKNCRAWPTMPVG